ncbi:MAG TPA: hypothetical protein VE221_07505 [Sphingomicrobium sp.]|nr:hypothetical protein [Sphingomicrobium sp.]
MASDGYFGAPAHLKQARCDAIQAAYHAEQARPPIRREPKAKPTIRRDPPPLPPAQVPTDDLLKLRLAEELEYARRMIETMGDALSTDPQLVMRHMVALQSIDIAGQILGHIANVIRSSDPKAAVELIGMCELRGRLKRLGSV